MQQQLTIDEFLEWVAYDRIHPLPDPWQQTGTLASVMAGMLGSGKGRPPSADDFIPKVREPKKQTAEQMRSVIESMVARSQGKRNGSS